MSFTRRKFLYRSAAAATWLATGCSQADAREADILVNHVGFSPHAAKRFLVRNLDAASFSVVEISSGQVAFTGTVNPKAGDLGNYGLGQFDALTRNGRYRIETSGRNSDEFLISPSVYESSIEKSTRYFAKQRCGDSGSGFHSPCHLDDGRRSDTGRHQDVSGGWHDACDLRKWVDATIYGMFGLGRVLDRRAPISIQEQIVGEMRWGNQYFRKMQEPAGYVMNFCGGDDGNRYTNHVAGDSDDRLIHIEPCELPAQFHFITAQAMLARRTREADPAYAAGCEDAARRCMNWCISRRSVKSALALSAAVLACIEMHAAFHDDQFQALAATYLGQLLALQVSAAAEPGGLPSGFFLASPGQQEPLRDIMHGNLPLLALCAAIAHFPEHRAVSSWKTGLQLHTGHLVSMAARSPFQTIPFGLYAAGDPGGNRTLGRYWYRYFMKDHNETSAGYWWVGINAHLASHGVGLAQAARLLGDDRLTHLAQHQLDWILGVNPFDASTVSGVGRNQPRLYHTTTFSPSTPEIPGGVFNGIGGTADDAPRLDPGSWNTCEYWTPMVAYTLWLMAELQAGNS